MENKNNKEKEKDKSIPQDIVIEGMVLKLIEACEKKNVVGINRKIGGYKVIFYFKKGDKSLNFFDEMGGVFNNMGESLEDAMGVKI